MSVPALVASPAGGRLLKQFSTTVVDQVCLSAANFIVGFLLIRRTTDGDYAMYVLVQSAIALLISAQMAYLSSPLAVLAPGKSAAIKRLMIGAVELSQRRFLRRACFAALAAPLVGYALHVWTGLQALAIVFGIFGCWAALQREYLRSVLMIYARPHSMLRADLWGVAVLLAGASIAAYGPQPAVLWAIAAVVASALVAAAVARGSLTADPGFERGDATPFWREMRPLATWATIGATIYWIYNQSYNYVLASRIDLTAVADVNATRLLLMPTIVLAVGVKTLLVPTAVSWLAESTLGRLTRRLLLFASGIAMLDILYFSVVWIFRDWISHGVMHKTIANRDALLLMWASLSLIAVYRDLLQTALFALRQFKSLAGVTAVSAAISLTTMWLGIKTWGPAAALIGQVAGESVNLLGVAALLLVAHRRSLMAAAADR